MQIPRKLILAGALFGLIPIGLGIAAIVTPMWIETKLNNQSFGTYGLFSCRNVLCSTLIPKISTIQGLEIAGVAAIAAGVIIAVLLDIFTKNRWIHLLPQVFLFAGPALILIGLILYAKYLFEYLSTLGVPAGVTTILDVGYSLILIIVACLLGFFTAIYFGFIAGYGRYPRSVSPGRSSSIVVIQQSERF